MSSSRKRKHRNETRLSINHERTSYTATSGRDFSPDSESVLFIQAYEADIIRGPKAASAAMSLEAPIPGDAMLTAGNSLILWNGSKLDAQPLFPGDVSEDDHNKGGAKPSNDTDHTIWVDRYVIFN